VSDELLERLVARLKAKLMDYAASRANDVSKGLESTALGGLIVQKCAVGMGDAVAIIEHLLDRRLPTPLQSDEATALVDLNWRDNMRARFQAQADLDLSNPRLPA
jgi:hypothetical protein